MEVRRNTNGERGINLWLQGPSERLQSVHKGGEKRRSFRKAQDSKKQRPALLGFILHSENSLTKPKATIPAPDGPKSSEVTEGLDYESTPSCPDFKTAGARGGLLLPGHWECGLLVYSGYGSGELQDGY